MNGGGGGDVPPPQHATNAGEFLLSLLKRQPVNNNPAQPQSQFLSQPPQQPSLPLDPAVAAVGPSVPVTPSFWHPYGGGDDLVSPPWQQKLSAATSQVPPGFLGLNPNPWSSQFQGNQNQQRQSEIQGLGLGFSNAEARDSSGMINDLIRLKQQRDIENKLQFGSFRSESIRPEGSVNLNMDKEREGLLFGNRMANGLERNRPLFDPPVNRNTRNTDLQEQERCSQGGRGGWRKDHYNNHNRGGNHRPPESQMPHSLFSNKSRGGGGGGGGSEAAGSWEYGGRKRESNHIVNKNIRNHNELINRNVISSGGNERLRSQKNVVSSGRDESLRNQGHSQKVGLTSQLDRPGPPVGSNLNPVSTLEFEESLVTMDSEIGEDGKGDDGRELDDLSEELVDSLLRENESEGNQDRKQNRNFRDKDIRQDGRCQQILSQRMRMLKWRVECRGDIDRLNAPFLSIFKSLIPLEEEKAKQKQLLSLLEKIVYKEWPEARLYLYGSCANSFGVLKSDIDVCLVMEDKDIDKPEILLRLAEILESDNLQNVQALTRARVPIVKLMDPATGISCDICINNVLAVVNTKLLRDYAEIDVRLRQLAYIVKHWAKSRGVNETYRGTLSSYAYVLMCIHFLQQRRPAILPCLQEMEPTYSVTIGEVECSFYDKVENLCDFGSRNKEMIAKLVWAFFNYWAYRHDYTNDVISVRTGSIMRKLEKDWTRRIGNDRHLICIEDPFETSHDLGRVVDKFTIKVLRHEFERAAEIMQYDPNPCVTLFEPYAPS